jgi:hypothetical protein
MYHINTSQHPGGVRRLLAATLAAATVIAGTASAATATSYNHNRDRDDEATTASRSALSFRTLDNPADPTFNQLLGINDRGRIVGYFGSGADATHPNKGYTVKVHDERPTFRNENFPGSTQTQVVGVNNNATTVGFYVDATGANVGFVARYGHFTSVTNPATPTDKPFDQLLGVNNRGVAVGFYNDAAGAAHSYTYRIVDGTFTPVALPVAADSVTATGINDHGDISGFYNAANVTTGFLLHDGHLEPISLGAGTNTQALGVNNNDRVVGSYLDTGGTMHGFNWSRSRHAVTVDAPQGTGGTLVNGLNNTGQLVGFYIDANGNTHGFVARHR